MSPFKREYALLEALTAELLADLVNEHLAEDWELHGDPFAVPQGDTLLVTFYQAMTHWSAPVNTFVNLNHVMVADAINIEPVVGCEPPNRVLASSPLMRIFCED